MNENVARPAGGSVAVPAATAVSGTANAAMETPGVQPQRILLKDCAESLAPDSVLPGLRVGSVGIVAGWGDVNMSALALQIGVG
ncbi:MAG TPA: hypothetical protein VF292_06655, partial [Rhodanobacteraceae bacterium]